MSTSATPATRNEGGGNQVPCLPRKVTRRHRRLIPPQARHQNQPTVPQVPCLPRKTKVDVAKCHALPRETKVVVPTCQGCHAKCRGVTCKLIAPQARHQSQPSAQCHACHANEGRCRQVPRLPHKRKVDVTKCHACHASAAASPATNPAPSAPPEPAQCPQCHTCHAKRRWMSPSAMPAT